MKIFILLLLITSSSFAQTKHLNDILFPIEYYSNISDFPNKSFQSNSFLLNMDKTIFGYLPWWEYITGNHQFINYDLLTHLAIFSFEADSLGNLKIPFNNWPWNDVISTARAKNVKLIIVVTSFDGQEINKLINDSAIREKLFTNIREIVLQYNFDGVNIDFENLLDGDDKKYAINNFMKLLSDYMKAVNQQLEISFASPAYGFGKWDFQKLSESCDYLFVMCYDFYGSWSNTTGPSSPLMGQYLSVTNTFEQEYKNVPPEKMILGVPYYGNYWKTKSGIAYAPVVPFDSVKTNNDWQSILRYREVIPVLSQYVKMWDNNSQSNWLQKKENDTIWYQIWYDDSLSLSKKYDLAIQKNLKGVGIWALGYDGNRSELWELIRKKFTNTTFVLDNSLPDDLVLFQNYPNPFNPETVISYHLPITGFVTLKIYDAIGREIVTLVNDYQSNGTYRVNFNVKKDSGLILPTGLYIMKLTFGNTSISRKMLLLK